VSLAGASAAGPGEPQLDTVQIELDSQARTHPALHGRDGRQRAVPARPAAQTAIVGIEDVVLLDAVAVVERELAPELGPRVAGREHLEHHLRRDAALAPLQVRAAVALGPPERHQRVRRRADLGVPFHGVPQQVAGDEDVRAVAEERLQPALDSHDPAELQGVIGHRLAVAVRVDDLVWRRDHRRCFR
jgi:hypothetical protein